MDCIFCKIGKGEMNTDFLYEDEDIVAFKDLNPQAPIHVLIIPKAHIASPDEIDSQNSKTVGKIFEVANKLAKDLGLDNGYRIVANCKEDGGQTVNHLHFHLLGGRKLQWPPG